jgi:hypothetical protein
MLIIEAMLDVQLEHLKISMRKKRILQARLDALKDHLLKEDKNAQIEELQSLSEELAQPEEESKKEEVVQEQPKVQDTSNLLLAVLAQSLQVQQAMLNNTLNAGSNRRHNSGDTPELSHRSNRSNRSHREEKKGQSYSRIERRKSNIKKHEVDDESIEEEEEEEEEEGEEEEELEAEEQVEKESIATRVETKKEPTNVPSLAIEKARKRGDREERKEEERKRRERERKRKEKRKKKRQGDDESTFDEDEEEESDFKTNDAELDDFLRETKKLLTDSSHTEREHHGEETNRSIQELIDTARREEARLQTISYTKPLARRRFERIVIIASFLLHMKKKREARLQLLEDSRTKLNELIDTSSNGAEKYLTQLVRIPLFSLLSDQEDLDIFSNLSGLNELVGKIGEFFGRTKKPPAAQPEGEPTPITNDKEVESKEFQARVIKIKAKTKIIIDALRDLVAFSSTKNESDGKNRTAIVKFFAILTHEYVLYPRDYMWQTEKTEIILDKDGALIEIDNRRARILILNLLIARILVLRIFRTENRGANRRVKNNLKIIQTLLYLSALMATRETSIDRVESLGPAIVQLMDPKMSKELYEGKKLDKLVRVFGDLILEKELIFREIADNLYEAAKTTAANEIDDTSPFLNYRIATNKQKKSYQKFAEYVKKKLETFEENMTKMRQLKEEEGDTDFTTRTKETRGDTSRGTTRTKMTELISDTHRSTSRTNFIAPDIPPDIKSRKSTPKPTPKPSRPSTQANNSTIKPSTRPPTSQEENKL